MKQTRKRAAAGKAGRAKNEVSTGSFLDRLPVRHTAGDEPATTARTSLFLSGDVRTSVTLILSGRMESAGLFQGIAAGTPSAPATDHETFAGDDRYLILGKKIRGVMRGILSRMLREGSCSDVKPCGTCEFCQIFGFFKEGGNSRLYVSDAWSTTPRSAQYVGSRSVTVPDSFLMNSEIVPPETEFLLTVRILNPSKRDIANILLGLEHAGLKGIGSRSIHYGKMSFSVLAVLGGVWTTIASVRPLLLRMKEGMSAEEAALSFIDSEGDGLPSLAGKPLREATRLMVRNSPLHPCYGEPDLEPLMVEV